MAKDRAAIDPDEDLFHFAEVMPAEAPSAEGEVDLDEIFAAFEEEERNELKAKDAPAPVATPPPVAAPAPSKKAPEKRPDPPSAPPAASVKQPALAASQPAAAEPVKEVAAAPPRGVRWVGASALLILLAMTALNVSIALVTLHSAAGMKGELKDASDEMSDAAEQIRAKVEEQAEVVKQEFAPVAPLPAEEGATFERAEADLEVGNFAQGRRRVYSLLAVVDRLPESKRGDIEARASFFLARSYYAEALAATPTEGHE
jgi:hypothetical protein